MEKTLFEDFTTLRWVKWTKRKPKSNGIFLIRWNGKNTSMGHVIRGDIYSLDGSPTKTVLVKGGKEKVKYSAEQKRLMKDMYWLEEVHDLEGLRKYNDELTDKFIIKQLQEEVEKLKSNMYTIQTRV